MSERFPWNTVTGWTVKSLANGSMLVEPKYTPGPVGLFTRLRMADWILQRLTKRRAAETQKDAP